MSQAMDETEVPEPLRAKLKEAFRGVADWMRNQVV